MNPQTSHMLRSLGLVETQTYSLTEAAAAPGDTLFYLRFGTGSPYSNRRYSAKEISKLLDHLNILFDQGLLISCGRSYDTIAGGISLVRQDFTYSEYVLGHSNALLRRGLCGVRVLQKENIQPQTLNVRQKWRSDQNRRGYVYNPQPVPADNLTTEVLSHLESLSQISKKDLLLEWMWTTEGFFFCDAHPMEDTSFCSTVGDMFRGEKTIVALSHFSYRNRECSGNIYVDSFDCENQSLAKASDLIVCINGAVLSHFVTRSIQNKVPVVWVSEAALAFETFSTDSTA